MGDSPHASVHDAAAPTTNTSKKEFRKKGKQTFRRKTKRASRLNKLAKKWKTLKGYKPNGLLGEEYSMSIKAILGELPATAKKLARDETGREPEVYELLKTAKQQLTPVQKAS